MRLRSLEIQGFKTFPNKTKLNFLDGISAVVGPNGSGKSNISDAIRWVLGEQSVKMLRCSKMEDVIFSGTQMKKSQGFAEVILTLQNSCDDNNEDEKDTVITRRYYRSGESEYLVNNKSVRLKDLNELFMDTGLGKDGYCVIGQGKIDSIISARSEERRELFEEAVGISKYRYRRTEAIKKLKQSEENLLRINDILSELECRIGPLEKQSQKAEKYIEYANERKGLEIGIWLRNLSDLSDFLSNQKVNIENYVCQKREVDAELESIEKQTNDAFIESNKLAVFADENRKNIEQSNNEINAINNKVLILENEIKHNGENAQNFQSEINELEISNKRLKDIVVLKKQKVEVKVQQIDEINLQLEQKNQELAVLTEKFHGDMLSYNEKFKKLDELEQVLSKNNITKILCESSIKNLFENELSLKNVVEDKKLQLKILSEKIDNVQKQINKSEEKLSLFTENVSSKKIAFEKINMNYKLNADKLNEIELNIKRMIDKIQLLEDMNKNMEGFSLSVKSIINEHRLGNLCGICGTVSSIMSVNEKYVMAMDVALGAVLQNIVVETEDDAKTAIAFLKNRKVGRATFLPLNTVKGKKVFVDNLLKFDGFIGIASDLCSYDEKYRMLIEYLLGRVVVANNIDNALKLSKEVSHKYKVVTLDGQVINSGGSMTGGFINKKTGTLTRVAEIQKLKKELDSYNKNRKLLESTVKKLSVDVSFVESEIKKNSDLEVSEKNSKSELDREINNLKFKKEMCSKELSQELENLKSIHININQNKEQIDSLKLSEGEIKKNIADLNIDKSSVQKISDDFMASKDNLNLCINNLKINSMSIQKEVDAINSEIFSYEQSKENKEKKINDLSNKISVLANQNEEYTEQIVNSKSTVDSLKGKIKECQFTDNKLKIKRIELEKKSVDLRKSEKDLLKTRECIVKDLTLMEERRDNFFKKQDNIIAKLWDEYGLTKSEAEEFTTPVDNLKESDKKLSELKMKIKGLGTVNLEAVEEFKEVNERYKFLSVQVKDIESSKEELKSIIDSLTDDMKSIFINKFSEINKNFSSIFKELFGGGEAKLIVLDPKDILSTGIEISVKPPGKLGLYLEALSGGEKALVAIALYFAIIKVNPAPFCVLDEIEAALDDINVSRFARYLKTINDKTQFIVITHRRGTMEEADVLYGVTMQDDGISKVLELKTNKFFHD